MDNTKEVIQSLIDCAVKEIISLIAKDLKELSFSDIVRITQKTVNNLGVSLIEQIVKIIDDNYNKQRDKHAVILRHTKTRKMVSGIGEINLTRRLYFNKTSGKYFFAVDELLNMEKYSRVDSELKKKLISDATLTSYGKASKLSNDCVSRQTVHNIVRRLPNAQLEAQAKGFKQVGKIYIEADEDHIHLNNGKNAEVKLVYVHEGRQRVCKGRTELKNVKYFVSISGGTEIWDAVADYLYFQYDVHGANIVISGDGAAWIKYGLTIIPRATYNCDKFHVYKSITDASAGNASFRKQVIENIKNDNRDKVLKLYSQRWLSEQKVQQRKRIADSISYIENNFETIDLTSEYSCSAEGHVSHVLSERLSSRPMAWSKSGAEKIAKLRAFYFNGGKFSDLTLSEVKDIKVKRNNCVIERFSVPDHSIPSGRILIPSEVSESVKKVLQNILNDL